jgi:hypothetical protein
MTQQPNQNYPQPGGWGQQQGQQPGWGQQQPAQQPAPQQGQQQWGAAQPSYGQQQPAQQYGSGTPSYGGASSAGGDSLDKFWGFYAAGALAAITLILTFTMPWASIKLGDTTFNFTALGSVSAKGHSASADGYPKIWGILVIVAAVIAIAGVVLAFVLKKAVMGWIVVGGSGLALIFALLAGFLGHNKIKDQLTGSGGVEEGTHYSLQMFGIGAWIGIVALLIGTVLAVLAQLSVNAGGASAGAGGSAQPCSRPATASRSTARRATPRRTTRRASSRAVSSGAASRPRGSSSGATRSRRSRASSGAVRAASTTRPRTSRRRPCSPVSCRRSSRLSSRGKA